MIKTKWTANTHNPATRSQIIGVANLNWSNTVSLKVCMKNSQVRGWICTNNSALVLFIINRDRERIHTLNNMVIGKDVSICI